MDSTPWAPLLEDAADDSHIALVYRDQDFLARAVAHWSAPILRRGGGAILVGTALHAVSIRAELQKLGLDLKTLERSGRLVMVDADWLMGHFILDGTPDAKKFRPLAQEIIRGVRRAAGGDASKVRAWGEMVSLLRLRGNPAAARGLEDIWTDVIREEGIALLCSYDLEGRMDDHAGFMHEVAHSHGSLVLQAEPPKEGVVVGSANV